LIPIIFNNNTIYGNDALNSGYDIYNTTPMSVDARYNWWEIDTTNVLATGIHPRDLSNIYDNYDDTNSGVVDYLSWQLVFTPPAMPVVNAVITPTSTATQLLAGTKETNSGIEVNGQLLYPIDALTTWSISLPLLEGNNSLAINSINASGLRSAPVDSSILLDTQAPVMLSSTPVDNSAISVIPATIEIILNEPLTSIDAVQTLTGATVNHDINGSVPGSWINIGSRYLFTPDMSLVAGNYTVTLNSTDTPLGNTQLITVVFTIDITIPQAVTLDAYTAVATTSTVTLSGTKDPDTAVYINGLEVVAIDSIAIWTYNATLTEGSNQLSITARDIAQNISPPVVANIILDSIAPAVASIVPANNSYIASQPATLRINVIETNSGINSSSTIASASISRNGSIPVGGNWTIEAGNVLQFAPSIAFVEGLYSYNAQLFDNAGSSTVVNGVFTYDGTPPALPAVNAVTSPTNSNFQILTGNKEAGSGIIVNTVEVILPNASTSWTYSVSLSPGLNSFNVAAKDQSNNQSGNVAVTIQFDDVAPAPVNALTVDASTNGNTALLNWTGYDEVTTGDIAGYNVYFSTALFTNVGAMTPAQNIVGAGNKAASITSLIKGQSYYFAVVAYDSNNNSQASVTPVLAIVTDSQPPEEVTNVQVTVAQTSVSFSWTASVNSNSDLDTYKVYFNNDAGTILPSSQVTDSRNSLTAATSYPVRITAIDVDGNESTGVTVNAVTLLSNPINIITTPYNNQVELTWDAVTPSAYVKNYALYASITNFTTVAGLSPNLVVSSGTTTRKLAGLDNNTAYYFAITAINVSDGEQKLVTTVSETPIPDVDGPIISNVTFGGAAIANGSVLAQSGSIALTATDDSGVGRTEFIIDGVVLSTDTNSANGIASFWELSQTTDGAHTVEVKAYDTLDNTTSQTFNITVTLAAPLPPSITEPASDTTTNLATFSVSGSSDKYSQIQLQNNGVNIGSLISVSSSGSFASNVTLTNGANSIQAIASNRGGTSVASLPVVITLDTSIPDVVTGLTAIAKESGAIRLGWTSPIDANHERFEVYRSNSPFADISSAVMANSATLIDKAYTDLPISDGTYYYSVIAYNAAGTASGLSNQVQIDSDGTPPTATSITYVSQGNVDLINGIYAPGVVEVTVTVSEPMLTTPYLSMAIEGGLPLSVSLVKTGALEYLGNFTITQTTISGTAYAVFSGRDLVGNRGTDVTVGSTIVIDTDGPLLSTLTLSPVDPIKNDSVNPVTLSLSLVFSEPLASSTTPAFSYLLSGAGRIETAITSLVQTDVSRWNGSIVLEADAGLSEVENLTFIYQGQDELGNVSTKINGSNSYQIYQGDLPPLGIPANLTAVAKPGGQVDLTWDAVVDAVAYQLYRKAPADAALLEYQRVTTLNYLDSGIGDGVYDYTVASVRNENGQESLSSQSAIVSVTTDSVAPGVPVNLTLDLQPNGINAIWQAPAGGEILTYNLYRDVAEIFATGSLTPIVTGVSELTTIDSTPSESDHWYAVTAVDEAGNESGTSVAVYQNFDLLPVSSLSVVQTDDNYPVLSWINNGSTIVGYDVFLGEASAQIKLNGAYITGTSYVDNGYTNNNRTYSVISYDNNDAPSLSRSIKLPVITATLTAESTVNRGIMNKLTYDVVNLSGADVTNVTMKASIEGNDYESTSFTILNGESKQINVIVGGLQSLPDLSALASSVVIEEAIGEKVEIIKNTQIVVNDSSLFVKLILDQFTRGGVGKVTVSIENTGEVVTEVITALSNGTLPSTELRLKLTDLDDNVLSVLDIKQDSGSTLRLATGQTVARMQPGETFISAQFDLPIPSTAPDNVKVIFEYDKYHYQLGKTGQISIAGKSTVEDGYLIDTAYYGVFDNVTPSSTYGGEDIVISGRALQTGTGTPMSSVPVSVVITNAGFERAFESFTDSTGNFNYTFVPLEGESGVYNVSVVHPDILDRPEQGTFSINKVKVNFREFNVNIPRAFDQTVSINATTAPGTTATNLRFVYDAVDQPSGVLVSGVQITPASPITMGPGETAAVEFVMRGDDTAPTSDKLVVKLISDESGIVPLASIVINFTFSLAEPVLRFDPSSNFLNTGVVQGESVSETIGITNIGLADMYGVEVSIRNKDLSPLPDWIYLTVPSDQQTLAIGETKNIEFVVAPPGTLQDRLYELELVVTSANSDPGIFRIDASVVLSGIGGVSFKVSDIYTQTFDVNGDLIPGLEGANILLQNERVISEEYTSITDNLGEALLSGIPSGSYKYRITANNHQETIGRMQIKAGVTSAEDVFLNYNLITVEWSVTETTIQDVYEITLNATYETQVPAAVVVAEPLSVSLPINMQAGSVFQGEITLTNHGLIRADNFYLNLPPEDGYFSFEFMNGAPTELEAQQSIVVPYRIVALKPYNSDGIGGAGCAPYSAASGFGYDYVCANGTISDGGGGIGFSQGSSGSSCGGSGTGSPGISGIRGGSQTSPSGGGSGTYDPIPTGGSDCVPDSPDNSCGAGGGGPGG